LKNEIDNPRYPFLYDKLKKKLFLYKYLHKLEKWLFRYVFIQRVSQNLTITILLCSAKIKIKIIISKKLWSAFYQKLWTRHCKTILAKSKTFIKTNRVGFRPLDQGSISSTAFVPVAPQSVRTQSSCQYLFSLLGSTRVKPVHRILMKLSPVVHSIWSTGKTSLFATFLSVISDKGDWELSFF